MYSSRGHFKPSFSSPQSSMFACSSRASSSNARVTHCHNLWWFALCACIIPSRPLNSGQMMIDKRKRRVGPRQSCCHLWSTNFKSVQISAECSFVEAPFSLGVCCPHVFALLPLRHCLSWHVWDPVETDVVWFFKWNWKREDVACTLSFPDT
jgi:hypothetical protein